MVIFICFPTRKNLLHRKHLKVSPERERGSNRDKSNRDLEAVKSALCPAGTKSYILPTTDKEERCVLKSACFWLNSLGALNSGCHTHSIGTSCAIRYPGTTL